MITIEEAVQIVLPEARPLSPVSVPLEKAGGYVLAEPVRADMDVPAFDRAMMDGYAIRSEESGDGEVLEIVETVAAGGFRSAPVEFGQAVKIMTGAPVPPGCDAVIPVELTTELDARRVRLAAPVRPGDNIARRGEEIQRGQEILSPGTLIDPPVAAVLAQAGKPSVQVHRRPRVGILVTGAELVGPGEAPAGGKIRESNSYGLIVQCRLWGAEPVMMASVGDDPSELKASIESGLGHDIFVITGGVSAGEFDLVPDLLQELGVEVLFHKVAQKPGMPMLLGKRDSSLVFGLPGNPVACFMCFELYAGPAARRMAGENGFETEWFEGEAAGDFEVNSNRDHLKVARAEFEDSQWRLHPMPSHGSADVFSVVGTNAFVRFEKGRYTVPAGEKVRFFLHRGKHSFM